MPILPMDNMTYKKLDQLAPKLVDRSIVTDEQLKQAVAAQKGTRKMLAELLLEKQMVSAARLAQFVAAELHIPFVSLQDYVLDENVLREVSEELIRDYQVLPLFRIRDTLTVATADPLDVEAIDAVRKSIKGNLDLVFCLPDDVRASIDRWFGSEDFMGKAIEGIGEASVQEVVADVTSIEQSSAEAPVVKLVDSIISQAVHDSASDIHIEPQDMHLQVRFRVDGSLRKVLAPPRSLHLGVVSRIKIMANMDIAESRRPQDGRMRLHVMGKTIDFRVSSYPTVHGEKLVVRVLDTSMAKVRLEALGLRDDELVEFRNLIVRPHGLLLVTGPTGSGKTTTLYSALSLINDETRNIMTIEDPVEYRLSNVSQGQVNEKAGITFSSALRAILRQDPDVVMVGEIRDTETCHLALRAALTGHLVLSTIHTNDAPSAVMRMLDMGAEPFLLSGALLGVLGQRLVRVLCPSCRVQYNPPEGLLKRMRAHGDAGSRTFYRQQGCPDCKIKGYRGRTGIFELMIPNEDIRSLIMSKASSDQIRHAARKEGMKLMNQDGLVKAQEGITTLEEVLRVVQ